MGVAATYCRGQLGLTAPLVQVEVNLGAGLPVFSIVGLPATAVKESKERVRAALTNSGLNFRPAASRSAWRLPICRRRAADSICRSP